MLKFGMKFSCCVATLLACGLPLCSQESRSLPKSGHPIVATVNRSQGKLDLTVEPNLAPNGELLRAFGILIEQRGRDYPVVVLVDSDSKLSDIFEASKFAGKAGFLNVRVFFVNHKSGFMSEIKLGSDIPISHNPPPESGPFHSP
jgi:hypothetical protein